MIKYLPEENRIVKILFLIATEINMQSTKNQFYESTLWRHKRAKILRRDKYLCQECKRYGRKRNGLPIAAALVHHIKPYEQFPELGLDDKNLVSLCEGCHNKMHPERGGTKRTSPPRYDKKTRSP